MIGEIKKYDGNIKLNKKLFENVNFHDSIGYLSQSSDIFEATIYEAILFGREDTKNRRESAIKLLDKMNLNKNESSPEFLNQRLELGDNNFSEMNYRELLSLGPYWTNP